MSEGAIGMAEVLQIFLALAVIIASIFGVGWLLRRMGGAGLTGGGHIRVIASMSVGSRERIAVIKVGGRQILVGITAQQISMLTEIDEPIDTEGENSPFARNLQFFLRRHDRQVGTADDAAKMVESPPK